MRIFWKTYSILFCFSSFINLFAILSSATIINQYYIIATQLSAINYIPFTLNIFLNLFNCFISLIVMAYAFNKPNNFLQLSQWFYLRFIIELLGHHFDILGIRSAFNQSHQLGYSAIIVFIIPMLPSYLAHYRYIRNK